MDAIELKEVGGLFGASSRDLSSVFSQSNLETDFKVRPGKCFSAQVETLDSLSPLSKKSPPESNRADLPPLPSSLKYHSPLSSFLDALNRLSPSSPEDPSSIYNSIYPLLSSTSSSTRFKSLVPSFLESISTTSVSASTRFELSQPEKDIIDYALRCGSANQVKKEWQEKAERAGKEDSSWVFSLGSNGRKWLKAIESRE